MRNRQSGFTMVELIMVIVILGILAAVAMPRFVDLSSDAKEKAFQGVRGAAASAMAINYASCAAVSHDTAAPNDKKCKRVDSCGDVGSLLHGSALPAGFSASGTDDTDNGDEMTCTLTQTGYTPSGATTFTGIAAGNP